MNILSNCPGEIHPGGFHRGKNEQNIWYVPDEIFPKLIYIPGKFLAQPGGIFRVQNVLFSPPLENFPSPVKNVPLQIPRLNFHTPPVHLDRVSMTFAGCLTFVHFYLQS